MSIPYLAAFIHELDSRAEQLRVSRTPTYQKLQLQAVIRALNQAIAAVKAMK
jgi:hypothetical protein